MSSSSLENGKAANLVALCNFKQLGDVKLHIQFPDYGDFRCYDLRTGCSLNQVDRRIYANFHNPSRGALKPHLFSAGTPKNFPEKSKRLLEMVKKGDFKQERMFIGVAKIQIANTFSGLVEMDFADYVDLAPFLHIRDTFPLFPRLGFRAKEKQSAEMARWIAISNWLSAFGASEIMSVCEDSRFI